MNVQSFLPKLLTKAKSGKTILLNNVYRRWFGVNSQKYWNLRFKSNWIERNGRLQTAFFAAGIALLPAKLENVRTVLDYGCGCGDSIPILKMRFTEALIYYFDFSEEAMSKATTAYGRLGTPANTSASEMYDLVYCSNVVEHIQDIQKFISKLIALSARYVVIQAPHNQLHPNGEELSANNPMDEHVRTVSSHSLDNLAPEVRWTVYVKSVPYAWDFGEQIFFVGDKYP